MYCATNTKSMQMMLALSAGVCQSKVNPEPRSMPKTPCPSQPPADHVDSTKISVGLRHHCLNSGYRSPRQFCGILYRRWWDRGLWRQLLNLPYQEAFLVDELFVLRAVLEECR
jgi:hypothetical protein